MRSYTGLGGTFRLPCRVPSAVDEAATGQVVPALGEGEQGGDGRGQQGEEEAQGLKGRQARVRGVSQQHQGLGTNGGVMAKD